MKEQNFSFLGADILAKGEANRNNPIKAFDWDKAAKIIKKMFAKHPDLVAEAGLAGDWDYTGGVIFENGKPTNDSYTYLASTWASPTLVLSWKGGSEEIIMKSGKYSRFDSDSKWDDKSLSILGIQLDDTTKLLSE